MKKIKTRNTHYFETNDLRTASQKNLCKMLHAIQEYVFKTYCKSKGIKDDEAKIDFSPSFGWTQFPHFFSIKTKNEIIKGFFYKDKGDSRLKAKLETEIEPMEDYKCGPITYTDFRLDEWNLLYDPKCDVDGEGLKGTGPKRTPQKQNLSR